MSGVVVTFAMPLEEHGDRVGDRIGVAQKAGQAGFRAVCNGEMDKFRAFTHRPPGITPSTMPSAASYEFPSFRAACDASPPSRSARKSSTPWVPPSSHNSSHIHALGLPSKAKAVEAALETARSEHETAKRTAEESLNARIDCAENAMDHLDSRIDSVTAAFQEHIIASTAVACLVQKRLEQLGQFGL